MGIQYVDITDEGYDPSTEEWEYKPFIKTRGCGCCSQGLPLTPELLEEAISDAEAWLEELKALRK